MIKFFKKMQYNRTNFMGGGLTPSRRVQTSMNSLFTDPRFKAPRKLDFRDMCVQTSNQHQTPHCAGYAVAGMIEIRNWQIKHYPEQVDGDAIYYEAKKIDGDDFEGTSLDSAAQAAINLDLINGNLKFVSGDFDSIRFCIHTNLSFVAGFSITDEWNMVNKNTGEIIDYGNKAQKRGGHAVLVCGYSEKGVYIQNSWGQSWGVWGYALIPWIKVTQQYMYGMVIL